MNRRTLSAALQTHNLPEQALQFVRGGEENTTGFAESGATQVQPEPRETPASCAPTLKPLASLAADPPGDASLVSLTVRVPRVVPPGLLLASVDRKLKRARPWTQQEIVAEALTTWLRNHGYLT